MPTFPKYESYKDSGVEWLGEIPSHWTEKKLKFIAQQISKKIEMKEQSGMYLGLENIESWTGKLVDTELTVEGIANRFQANDVLFGKLRPYLAKVHLARQAGFCTTEALVLRFSKAEPNFFFYLLLSKRFIELVNSSVYGSKMPRASWEFIGSQYLPLPPVKEQKRIVEFLDRTTGEIDGAIAQKQRLIELLQEQKAILINQAVTKGLNPNAPMRDSGIEWVGKVPEHWTANLKFLSLCQLGRGMLINGPFGSDLLTSELVEEGIDVIYIRDLKPNKYSRVSKSCILSNKYEQLSGFAVFPRDLLVAKVGDPPGFSCVYPENSPPAIVTQDVIRARLNPELCNADFLAYYFNSSVGQSSFDSVAIESTRKRVSLGDVKKIKVDLPPIQEQKEIVDFLDSVSVEHEGIEKTIKQGIEKLKELRQVTISNAVTGKIKV